MTTERAASTARAVVPTRHRKARIYQNLRTAHLERAHHHTPASILFVRRSYDFDESVADGLDLLPAGTLRAALIVLISRLDVIEVNEPLARLRLPRTLLSIKAARLAARLRGGQVAIVAHAIENRDPFREKQPRASSAKSWLRARLEWWLTLLIARELDRLSYGTPMAQDLYTSLLGRHLRRATTKLLVELPAACSCLEAPAVAERDLHVTFLGAFDERKGVRALLAAWPLVHALDPRLRLQLVGKGPLVHEVAAVAATLPSVEVTVDPSRDEVHRILRRTQTLVLLSQPRDRWREQVGLPIVEGLAHGCTVVTTDQTGLAPWLAEHRHVVVSSSSDPAGTARAIVSSARMHRSTADVLADLPTTDGRTMADRWLFTDQEAA